MVENGEYRPERGDIIWLSFHPQLGREQTGRRPAIVLSPGEYNGKVGLLLACPVTSRIKGYPFEVVLPEGLPVSGAILSDQVKSLDWKARGAELAYHAPRKVIDEVLGKVSVLLG